MKRNIVFERVFETENSQIKAHPRAYVVMAALEELQAAGREIDRRGVSDPDFIRLESYALIRNLFHETDNHKIEATTDHATALALDSDKMLSTKAELLDGFLDSLDAQDFCASFNSRAYETVGLHTLVIMKHMDQDMQATEIGIDPKRFDLFVHGKLMPSPNEQKKIAIYYGTTVKGIFG